MLTSDIFNNKLDEVSQDWNERWKAGEQLADLFNKKYKKGNFTAQDVAQAQALVKIAGRAHNVGRGGYRKYTAGNILDDIVEIVRNKDIAAGKTPELTRAPTTRQMAKQIAAITKGHTAWRNPTTWSTNYGDRYRDAADHVEYDDEAAYNAAWKFIQSKGKQVHYKESGHLHTAIQIGSFIIEPSSRTMGYFSDNPETTHSISVRTVKSLGGRRQKQDISDEQAAKLQQIARNQNDATLTLLKIIFKTIGEKDAAETIANSEKLSPAEKAKLGKIVNKGQQGVAEGFGAYDNDKGIRHTRESLVAKLEALPKGDEEFEWHKNRAIYHLKQGNMIRARYYMAKMKRGEQGVAEAEEQGIDNKYRRIAKDILKVYETNPEVKAIVDASPEPYRALVYETGVIKNPERLDGTTHYLKLVDELESITHNGRGQGVAEDSDPCWTGYKQIGMKQKGGKKVPNCVPKESRDHISPSGVKTNMPPSDDDYEINYGKNGLVAKDRKSRGVDVKTGTKKVREGTDVVPATNPEDSVTLDIPLLIRLLEYSREDAKTDMDLHNVAERLITLSAGGKTLSMNDYDTIIPGSSN